MDSMDSTTAVVEALAEVLAPVAYALSLDFVAMLPTSAPDTPAPNLDLLAAQALANTELQPALGDFVQSYFAAFNALSAAGPELQPAMSRFVDSYSAAFQALSAATPQGAAGGMAGAVDPAVPAVDPAVPAVDPAVPAADPLVCTMAQAKQALTDAQKNLSFEETKVCAVFVMLGVNADGSPQTSLVQLDVAGIVDLVRAKWVSDAAVEAYNTPTTLGDEQKQKFSYFVTCMDVLNEMGIIQFQNKMGTRTLLDWQDMSVIKATAWWAFLRAVLPEDQTAVVLRKSNTEHLFGSLGYVYELMAYFGYGVQTPGSKKRGRRVARPAQPFGSTCKKGRMLHGLSFHFKPQQPNAPKAKRLDLDGRSSLKKQLEIAAKRTEKTEMLEEKAKIRTEEEEQKRAIKAARNEKRQDGKAAAADEGGMSKGGREGF